MSDTKRFVMGLTAILCGILMVLAIIYAILVGVKADYEQEKSMAQLGYVWHNRGYVKLYMPVQEQAK